MGKLAIILAAGALLLGSFASTAQAQTQGASSIQAQIQNATPIQKVGCFRWGRCPPGSHWICGPRWGCRCAPC